MEYKETIKKRVSVTYYVMLLISIGIVGKMLHIQILEGDQLRDKAKKISQQTKIAPAIRGEILDCHGRLLAGSVPDFDIRMDVTVPHDTVFNKHIDSLSIYLSRLFPDKKASEYKRNLIRERQKGNRYYLIQRDVSYIDYKTLSSFPIFRKGRYKGGLIKEMDNKRLQPHGQLASRTIGYLSKSEAGNVVGLEGAFDEHLTGVSGYRIMQRLTGGDWMPVSEENQVDPKDGKDIVTTIDINIQDVAHHALLKQLQKNKAQYGTAILMEVKTGEIKAIANLGKRNNGSYGELYNYAIGASTEPGSTFKLASIIAALEDDAVTLKDSLDTKDGIATYYGHKLKDSHIGGYGVISVQEGFEKSSNVLISQVISNFYKGNESQFIERLYSMGLNKKTGIDIKGEGKPLIKHPEDKKSWSGITLPWMSIGYEVQLTPLQTLTFYNAVANNGVMVKPKLVNAIMQHGSIVQNYPTEVLNPGICSAETIKKAKIMLEGVVERGTATNLKNPNYKIAGKTGTAQIANDKYGYKNKAKTTYQGSFVGYFPADNPQYSCIVVVSAPSNNVYYGNLVAGPVFKEIADKVYSTSIDLNNNYFSESSEAKEAMPYTKSGSKTELLAILDDLDIEYKDQSSESNWIHTYNKDSIIDVKGVREITQAVPNVKSMGLKDALFVLENRGLKVRVKGYGTVISQSIPAGSRFKKGATISLKMSLN